MDYIIFGAGTGASLAVIGWVLREWGPGLRDGKREDGLIHSASELIDRMSWARFCASCGMALVFGGTLILLATAIVAIWNPGDTLAARIMIGTYVGVSLLMLAWSGLYARQFGASGIYRPAPPKPIVEPTPIEVVREDKVTETVVIAETSGAEETVVESQDIESVAASPGGLGRFAAFFKRGATEPEPPASDEDDDTDYASSEDSDDQREQARTTDSQTLGDDADLTDDGSEEVVVTEAEQVTIDESGDAEVIEEDILIESETRTSVNQDQDQSASQESSPEDTAGSPSASATSESTDSDSASAEKTVPEQDTPEDTALAELRRRRLARLSGNDSSNS